MAGETELPRARGLFDSVLYLHLNQQVFLPEPYTDRTCMGFTDDQNLIAKRNK